MTVYAPHALPTDRPHVLFDTGPWLAAATGDVDELHPDVFGIIERAAADNLLFVSVASAWEAAIRARTGVMNVENVERWLADQERPPGVKFLPITAPLAAQSLELPPWPSATGDGFHTDPIDRFIAATARHHQAFVMTLDPAFIRYGQEGAITVIDARRIPTPVSSN